MTQARSGTIYMSSVTTVDMAYYTPDHKIRGLSFRPCISVSGKLVDGEEVVADFSSIKKDMKHAIDDHLRGYDHKLVYDPEIARLEPSYAPGVATLLPITRAPHDHLLPGYCTSLVTAGMNGFRTLEYAKTVLGVIRSENLHTLHILEIMAAELEGYLSVKFPSLSFQVTANSVVEDLSDAQLTPAGYAITRPCYFSYTHGLAQSTSWGCQFIAHGHTSFLQLLGNRGVDTLGFLDMSRHPNQMPLEEILLEIRRSLDDKYIVNSKYVHPTQHQHLAYVSYVSQDRGRMEYQFDTRRVGMLVIDDEPTIENIANWIIEQWGPYLRKQGATGIYVSEGLTKGALASCL